MNTRVVQITTAQSISIKIIAHEYRLIFVIHPFKVAFYSETKEMNESISYKSDSQAYKAIDNQSYVFLPYYNIMVIIVYQI